MSQATRIVKLVVTTQRGTNADARRVLQDIVNDLRDPNSKWSYLSVGEVTVEVKRP
jgi:hypothetical protein